jgi:glutaredoxin|tara:strand:- start:134 stop:373 length:240 start_codon:yes stop_codon:yes gene_type:complete
MATWTIYSKNQCPFCDKAKYALRDEDVEVKNISENSDYRTEMMIKNPVARTMPQVFKGDELIGGFDALETYLALQDIQL